jgi:hypothetical protein
VPSPPKALQDGPRQADGLVFSAAAHVHDWRHQARAFKTLTQADFETMADPSRPPGKQPRSLAFALSRI